MKKYFELLDRVIIDSKALSREDFEGKYKGHPIKIILNVPAVINDSLPLFRGRLAKVVGKEEDLSNPVTFSYVPLKMNMDGKPQMGRANYEGQSIFYASANMKTNFIEISKDCHIDDEAYMAKWVLRPNSNLHLYRTIPAQGISESGNSNSIFTITNPTIVNSSLGTYLKKLGSIIMSNEEQGKYLGSSYISNCIYSSKGCVKDADGQDIEVHYDGILYPSAIGDVDDVNIAITPKFVDSNLSLEYVVKGNIASDMCSVKFKKIGINENGKIVWYEAFVDENSITNIVPRYYNSSYEVVDTTHGQILDAENHVVSTEKAALDYLLMNCRDQIFEKLRSLIDIKLGESKKIDKASIVISKDVFIGIDLKDWKVVKGNTKTTLCKVIYYFTLKSILREIGPNKV